MRVGSENRQVAWIQGRLSMFSPSQAFISPRKDPGINILQQEGGTLAPWLGHPSCCGVWGRHSVSGEQELSWSSGWEDAPLFLHSPHFSLSLPDQQHAARAGKWPLTSCHAPPYPSVPLCHWRSPACDLLCEPRLLKSSYGASVSSSIQEVSWAS